MLIQDFPVHDGSSAVFILGQISGKLDMILSRLDTMETRHTKLEDRILSVEDQLKERIEATDARLDALEGDRKQQKFIIGAVSAIAVFAIDLAIKIGGILWEAFG